MPQGQIGLANTPVQGGKSVLNIGQTATLVKGQPGKILQINVTAAADEIAVYDSATTAGTAASNLVYISAATEAVGVIIPLDFPMANGIVVLVNTAGTVAVSYA